MRIGKRGPQHERLLLIGCIFHIGNRAVGDPRVVVQLGGHVDAVGLLGAARGRRGGFAVPEGEHIRMLALEPVVVFAR